MHISQISFPVPLLRSYWRIHQTGTREHMRAITQASNIGERQRGFPGDASVAREDRDPDKSEKNK